MSAAKDRRRDALQALLRSDPDKLKRLYVMRCPNGSADSDSDMIGGILSAEFPEERSKREKFMAAVDETADDVLSMQELSIDSGWQADGDILGIDVEALMKEADEKDAEITRYLQQKKLDAENEADAEHKKKRKKKGDIDPEKN